MSSNHHDEPTTNPRTRLRELLETETISSEIADLRLSVLRQEVPDALVQIDSVRADDTAIAVKATIATTGKARHTAIAAADVDADVSWAEQFAMQQAIAIARALDGLGLTTERVLERPKNSRPTQQQQSAVPQAHAEVDHLPEYSWNAFWQSMNAHNITREQVEQALGKTVQEVTPKEAVDALTSAGLLT